MRSTVSCTAGGRNRGWVAAEKALWDEDRTGGRCGRPFGTCPDAAFSGLADIGPLPWCEAESIVSARLGVLADAPAILDDPCQGVILAFPDLPNTPGITENRLRCFLSDCDAPSILPGGVLAGTLGVNAPGIGSWGAEGIGGADTGTSS
jgi:hypothetical protein